MNQNQLDSELFVRLGTLHPDERRHLLNLLESGGIMECSRSKTTEELKSWAVAQKRQCQVNVCARNLVKKVEGFDEYRNAKGVRIRDTHEWCSFYSAVRALDSENM